MRPLHASRHAGSLAENLYGKLYSVGSGHQVENRFGLVAFNRYCDRNELTQGTNGISLSEGGAVASKCWTVLATVLSDEEVMLFRTLPAFAVGSVGVVFFCV